MVTCEHINLCVTHESCFAMTFVSPGSIRLWLTQSRLHWVKYFTDCDTLDEFCVHVWNVLSATLQTARLTLCCSLFPRHPATSSSWNLSPFSLNESVDPLCGLFCVVSDTKSQHMGLEENTRVEDEILNKYLLWSVMLLHITDFLIAALHSNSNKFLASKLKKEKKYFSPPPPKKKTNKTQAV